MKTKTATFTGFSSTALKLIALITMATDHIGMVLLPEQMWLRAIGRVAMPIFAFCVAEGFTHTHSRARYLLRLAVFALISELPFDLAVSGGVDRSYQNVMFTFALAVAALWSFECLKRKETGWLKLAAWVSVAAIAGIAALCSTDYGFAGVALVFFFYILRDKPSAVRVWAALAAFCVLDGSFFEMWCFMSAVPLMLYNGEKGAGLKWTFYLFYPLHLLMIYLALLGLMKL